MEFFGRYSAQSLREIHRRSGKEARDGLWVEDRFVLVYI